MPAIFRNDIEKRRKVVQIALAVILTLGLSLSHACAALSSLGPPSSCKSAKSINHKVDHVKKASCKMLPCKSGQGRVLLAEESVETRAPKGSPILLATILPGQFEVNSDLAHYGRIALTDPLRPPPTNSPPIYIKNCSLLR